MLGKIITKNSLSLGAFAFVTTAILALTAQFTKSNIEKSEREAQQKALFEIVPRITHDNDMLVDTIQVPQEAWAGLGLKSGGVIYLAKKDQKVIAAIIPAVAPDGYSGDIRMIVGVNADGSLAGVRVLDHHETPGLGDKIELKKTSWILGFNGKSSTNPDMAHWKVKKDGGQFDQFAGATITPRAVVNQIRRVIEFSDSHKALLFGATSQTAEQLTEQNSPTEEHTHE